MLFHLFVIFCLFLFCFVFNHKLPNNPRHRCRSRSKHLSVIWSVWTDISTRLLRYPHIFHRKESTPHFSRLIWSSSAALAMSPWSCSWPLSMWKTRLMTWLYHQGKRFKETQRSFLSNMLIQFDVICSMHVTVDKSWTSACSARIMRRGGPRE